MAEVGLSARTHDKRGTARTLAGSVRYCAINYTAIGYTAIGEFAHFAGATSPQRILNASLIGLTSERENRAASSDFSARPSVQKVSRPPNWNVREPLAPVIRPKSTSLMRSSGLL